jgi:V/A-type H+/Na+-transporting ATPase subunit I
MPSSDRSGPVRMSRVALVSPRPALRALLAHVADAGCVEVDVPASPDALPGPAARALQRLGAVHTAPAICEAPPDVARAEDLGRADVVAGEAALERILDVAVTTPTAGAVAGWTPSDQVDELRARLAPLGGAVVEMPRPAGAVPPTLLRRRGTSRPFTTLVETYATVPYADIDPTPFAAVTFVLMFGIMFGDVGQGLLLVLLAVLARLGRPRVLAPLRPASLLIGAAGVAATCFGFAYGEFFGPTGVIEPLWMAPLDDPLLLLTVALAFGALLLGIAYGIGTVNRVREGGWSYALYAPTGFAGATLFLSVGMLAAGILTPASWLVAAAAGLATVGLVLSFIGLYTAAGRGGAAVVEAIVGLFDVVISLASNIVSFARLAAFGLVHAALGVIVWNAASSLWGRSPLASVSAVLVMVLGTAVAFALEALVAAVQALRLEYYELFSRVFEGEGRPFRPWHVPLISLPEALAPPPTYTTDRPEEAMAS